MDRYILIHIEPLSIIEANVQFHMYVTGGKNEARHSQYAFGKCQGVTVFSPAALNKSMVTDR